jgi:ribosomal protein S18 acetylase RimI-like enzyme
MEQGISIRTDLKPGDLGTIIYLHAKIYADDYGYDTSFEIDVADGLSNFAQQYDPQKDRIFIAERDDKIIGSIVVHGLSDESAQVRWVLVHPDARGQGLGRELFNRALTFCRESGFHKVFLYAQKHLDAAVHLYTSAGFTLIDENPRQLWGREVVLQRYEREFPDNGQA